MKKTTILALIYSICGFSQMIWARAGGAGGGGGHSSGGGGGGFHGGSYGGGGYSTYNYGGSGNSGGFGLIISLLFICLVIYIIYKNNLSDAISNRKIKLPTRPLPPADLSALGEEGWPVLQKKVQTAFLTVQESWSAKNLNAMRKFITDGIYQRFHAQMTMMNLLEQSNPITEVVIHSLQIAKTYKEGGYSCVDVRVVAEATDQFICRKYPQLNSPGGRESFTEYWSFIRRLDYKRGSDIFQSDICPQCSAALTGKLIETARCPYCSTYLNSGEYDWVLSEITQENDYGRSFSSEFNLPASKTTPLAQVLEHFPSFSRQVVEDRASNAFMQILIAIATKNSQILQKFSTPEAYQKLSLQMPQGHLAYDRLYTRSVDLIDQKLQGDTLQVSIGIEYSSHLIHLDLPASAIAGSDSQTPHTAVLLMKRELSSITAKGSIFAGSCPHCGAPQKNSLSAVCEYCAKPLNDARLDWVVSDLIDLREYRTMIATTSN